MARHKKKGNSRVLLEDMADVFYTHTNSETEELFFQTMRRRGARLINRGWPDFAVLLCNSRVILVEVKNHKNRLTPSQLAILTLLTDHGLDVRISKGKTLGRVLSESQLERGRAILSPVMPYSVQRRLPTRKSF